VKCPQLASHRQPVLPRCGSLWVWVATPACAPYQVRFARPMCNAWNHSFDCTCGWGGVGHAGRRSGWLTALVDGGSEWTSPRYETYTTPGASCPVCGASVYFYQSESGGRVFFDQLGPPWPKHPCTDTGTASPRPSRLPVAVGGAAWQSDGWTPFLDPVALSYSPLLYRLSGQAGAAHLTIYVRKAALPPSLDLRDLVGRSFIHARVNRDGSYLVSLLGPSLEPIELLAYTSEAQAGAVSLLPPKVGRSPSRVRSGGKRI
jgi:hypothetical protein